MIRMSTPSARTRHAPSCLRSCRRRSIRSSCSRSTRRHRDPFLPMISAASSTMSVAGAWSSAASDRPQGWRRFRRRRGRRTNGAPRRGSSERRKIPVVLPVAELRYLRWPALSGRSPCGCTATAFVQGDHLLQHRSLRCPPCFLSAGSRWCRVLASTRLRGISLDVKGSFA
jgi:hypothetical protein